MRVDQLISQMLPLSRKEVKQRIREKRVLVNHELCKDAGMHVTENDTVSLDGTTIPWPHELYYLLNKPAGYCCSHDDDGAVSALKLLPATGKKLHFAGRLDTDTTGLVLVSSDGQWCHRVTSPKQRNEKRKWKHYRVTLALPLSAENVAALEQGLLLNGENEATLPANITHLDERSCEIAICEGRYHQVKRMFAAVGNHVEALHRFRIGDILLDNTLPEGGYRPLTTAEIDEFLDDA